MLKKLTSSDKILLVVILITGCILRLFHFSSWSLSNDELSALSRLEFPSLSSVIENGVKLDDMHPPGVQVFLLLLTNLFGKSVFVVRLPFVLAGIASIYIFFLLSFRWIGKQGALVATALFSSLIFPVLYSQLARPYSFGLLFTLLNVYFLTRILYNSNGETKSLVNKTDPTIYIITGALCMYTHYFAFLFAGITGITGLLIANQSIKRWIFGAGIGMFILYIPALPVFLYQMGIGGLGGEDGWLGPPQKDAFLQLVYFIFNESKVLLGLVLIGFTTSYIIQLKTPVKNKYRLLSLILFLLPFLIAYFYSILKNPVYQHSIMLFNFPFLLIYICSFIPKENNKIYKYVIPAILLITVTSTIAEKRFYTTNYFGVFKELVLHADTTARKYGKENITFTSNVIKPYYINYYHEQLNVPVRYDLYSFNTTAGLSALDSLVKNSSSTYFSYAWSNTLNRDETDLIIRNNYPYLVVEKDYFNSGYRLYTKISGEGRPVNTAFSFIHDFERSQLENDSILFSSANAHSGKQSVHYTSNQEYGPTFRKTAEELHLNKGDMVAFSAWIFTNDSIEGSLVIQMNQDNKTLFWTGASAKDYINKSGKWMQIFAVHKVTEEFHNSSVISAYYWNSGKRDLYIDDFRIEVIKQ